MMGGHCMACWQISRVTVGASTESSRMWFSRKRVFILQFFKQANIFNTGPSKHANMKCPSSWIALSLLCAWLLDRDRYNQKTAGTAAFQKRNQRLGRRSPRTWAWASPATPYTSLWKKASAECPATGRQGEVQLEQEEQRTAVKVHLANSTGQANSSSASEPLPRVSAIQGSFEPCTHAQQAEKLLKPKKNKSSKQQFFIKQHLAGWPKAWPATPPSSSHLAPSHPFRTKPHSQRTNPTLPESALRQPAWKQNKKCCIYKERLQHVDSWLEAIIMVECDRLIP